MPPHLTDSDVSRFHRDGFLFPLPVLAPAETLALRAKVEVAEARYGGRLPQAFNSKIHLLMPALYDLVLDPRIVDAVEDLIGPDLLCFATSFISKSGHDERFVSWHQDATHWGLTEPVAVTAWVALTDSGPDNGCVRALPGSHRRPVAHANMTDPANMLGRKEYVVDIVNEADAVDFELAPGEMSLHHPLAVHGSAANTSGRRRLGFAIRYIPAHLRHTGDRANSATYVRGRDLDHFAPEARPDADFSPAARERHAAALRLAGAIIFDGKPASAQ